MAEATGASQCRHIRISSINTTRDSLRSAGSLEAAGWGIPYRCFVGVGLTWVPCLPLCAIARGLQLGAKAASTYLRRPGYLMAVD